MSQRSEALAERLVQGAVALAAFARGLTDAEWNARIPHDGRTVAVIVHHVATMYPLEIQLAQQIAAGETARTRPGRFARSAMSSSTPPRRSRSTRARRSRVSLC